MAISARKMRKVGRIKGEIIEKCDLGSSQVKCFGNSDRFH